MTTDPAAIPEPALVAELVRRSLAGELSRPSLDVCVALFSAEVEAPDDMPLEHYAATSALDDMAAESASGDTASASTDPPSYGVISLGPRESSRRYGRNQRDPSRRYRTLPSGRAAPLCEVPGCESLAQKRRRCKQHGGV